MKLVYGIENLYMLKIEVIAEEKVDKIEVEFLSKEKLINCTSPKPKINIDTTLYKEMKDIKVRIYGEEKVEKKIKDININKLETGKSVLKNKPVLILGVNKDTAFIITVLKRSYWIHGILTDNKDLIGNEFFEVPIMDIDDNDFKYERYNLISVFRSEVDVNYYSKKKLDVQYYNPNFNSDNIVINQLYGQDIITLYNLSKWCLENKLESQCKLVERFIKFKYNTELVSTTTLGQSVSFGYGGIGVVIHKNAIIGDYVKIGQNVTIGQKSSGRIIIGSNVFISPGSKVLANIGNNVIVEANSTVIKDVPDNVVVAGNPAKIISKNIKEYIDRLPKKGIL